MGEIRDAASVILLREAQQGFEVFLLRRHRGASFMASAYVFPGGAAEPGEDARTTAARELFEEAGVLLARDAGKQAETLQVMTQETMRAKVLAGQNAAAVLELTGLAWSTDALVPWSHWITPSIEPKRFSARFFIGELPSGQEPMFDATETVDQAWVTPAAALERRKELGLPPPQIRTFWELSQYATIADVVRAARVRADEPHPIMPRLAPPPAGVQAKVAVDPKAVPDGVCLLLPWDPDYTVTGIGEGTPLTYKPSWARGPSRFVLDRGAWTHV